jgi:hypothetical protein
MRVFMTSFAALLVLVAFGPGVTGTALGGDTGTNAGTNSGTAGVAGAPAFPPAPAPVPAPTLAPTPPPAPVPTFAPGPVGQATAAVPDARDSSQPAYGYYQPSPNGYYQGPYRYSTGYHGCYGPVYQGGYYYGPGGYYGQPGISIGLGFGRGLRIGY